MKQILAIILARGGSKGIPRKNIALLAGKPLIAWTIEAAMHSPLVSRIIISTDDQEIADVSLQLGGEVPFIRPAALAQDNTTSADSFRHAILWMDQNHQLNSDYAMLLQPTSPLRTSEDIDAAIELALQSNAESVVSVCKSKSHPYWTFRLNETGKLCRYLEHDLLDFQKQYTARQDLPPAYALNGAIYLIKVDVFLAENTFLPDGTIPYVMPPERSLDIDTPWEFRLAEWILNDQRAHENR
jgi:CMP-N-acetylneuraminic acid synthetase